MTLLVTVALVLVCGSVAEGQDAVPGPTRGWTTGILTITPALAVRDFGLDTNLFHKAADPKSDVTFVVSPQATTSLGGRAGRVTVGSRLDLVYFRTYVSERSVNSDTHVELAVPIGRLRLRSAASYVNAHRRQNSEIDARVRGAESALLIGGAVRVSGVTTLDFEARGARVAFAGDQVFDGELLPARLNRDAGSVSTALRYAVTPLTTVVVQGAFDRWRFPLSPVRNADSLRVVPGVEFAASALVSGRAAVGYRVFEGRDPALPDFKGLVASGDLTFTIGPATRLAVLFDRDVTYSYRTVRPYYLSTTWGGAVRHRLGSGWEVEARGGRETLDYAVAAVPGLEGVPPETVHHYGLRVSYGLSPDTRILVDVDHQDRASSLAHRNYHALRTGVTISYGF